MSRIKVPTDTRRLYDGSNTTVQYFGEAAKGSETSNACWKITRLLFSGPSSVLLETGSPNGSSEYSFVWDLRTTYTYK